MIILIGNLFLFSVWFGLVFVFLMLFRLRCVFVRNSQDELHRVDHFIRLDVCKLLNHQVVKKFLHLATEMSNQQLMPTSTPQFEWNETKYMQKGEHETD